MANAPNKQGEKSKTPPLFLFMLYYSYGSITFLPSTM